MNWSDDKQKKRRRFLIVLNAFVLLTPSLGIIPPEVLKRERICPEDALKADVFSFAMLLFEIVTLRKPFAHFKWGAQMNDVRYQLKKTKRGQEEGERDTKGNGTEAEIGIGKQGRGNVKEAIETKKVKSQNEIANF